jgi:hypothetical protein
MLEMCFNKEFDTVKLIGQDGTTKKTEMKNDTVKYTIQEQDTYIRAEINQSDKSNAFFNPVFRYSGELKKTAPEIDVEKTWIYRGIYLFLGGFVLILYLRYRKQKVV